MSFRARLVEGDLETWGDLAIILAGFVGMLMFFKWLISKNREDGPAPKS